jgi:hypothetical protein
VTTLLRGQHPAEALQLLDQMRAHESTRPAVQEALDRYAVADASTELNALRAQQTVDSPTFASTLDRLHKAETQPPRVPERVRRTLATTAAAVLLTGISATAAGEPSIEEILADQNYLRPYVCGSLDDAACTQHIWEERGQASPPSMGGGTAAPLPTGCEGFGCPGYPPLPGQTDAANPAFGRGGYTYNWLDDLVRREYITMSEYNMLRFTQALYGGGMGWGPESNNNYQMVKNPLHLDLTQPCGYSVCDTSKLPSIPKP